MIYYVSNAQKTGMDAANAIDMAGTYCCERKE